MTQQSVEIVHGVKQSSSHIDFQRRQTLHSFGLVMEPVIYRTSRCKTHKVPNACSGFKFKLATLCGQIASVLTASRGVQERIVATKQNGLQTDIAPILKDGL